MGDKQKLKASKGEKGSKGAPEKIKSKKVNIEIAPGNWVRLEKYINDFNDNPERTASKLKYTNVVNDALAVFFSEYDKSNDK